MELEYLIYLPIIAFIILFWYLGAQVFEKEEPNPFSQKKKKALRKNDLEWIVR